jgi:hypothetical protein
MVNRSHGSSDGDSLAGDMSTGRLEEVEEVEEGGVLPPGNVMFCCAYWVLVVIVLVRGNSMAHIKK